MFIRQQVQGQLSSPTVACQRHVERDAVITHNSQRFISARGDGLGTGAGQQVEISQFFCCAFDLQWRSRELLKGKKCI